MARVPLTTELLHDIYIDESSQTQNRFLVIGGIIVPTKLVSMVEQHIATLRMPELPNGEMKWAKVSRAKLIAYKRVVAGILRPPSGPLHAVEFHSLVVDTTKLRDGVFNRGSREIGFNKEVYQLCQKFGRTHRDKLYYVYLDYRDTRSRTADLRDIVNRGIMVKQSNADWPYRRVHFRDSARCLPLQVVDLLIGSIAFRLNGHYAALGASEAKRELSDHVLSLAGVRDVTRDTNVRGRFTIWHRQLR